MFDSNKILLDDKRTTNIVSVNENSLFSSYQFYHPIDEAALKHSILHSKDHQFIIKYQVFPISDDDETLVECLPVEILPMGLSLQDYDIRFDQAEQRVKEIRNRKLGLVKFNSYRIDQQCGYVRGSIIKLYSHLFRPDILNIVHIHVNDTSEEVTFDVAYMQEGQTLNDMQEFTVDQAGQKLRYKVIVSDMNIVALLYNDGTGSIEEIPFEEIRISGNCTTLYSKQNT